MNEKKTFCDSEILELKKQIEKSYDYLHYRNIESMQEDVFVKFKEYVEILEESLLYSNILMEEKSKFLDQILAIKTGAKVPLLYFTENKKAKDFFEINNFGNIFFTSKVTARYDSYMGLLLPIEITKQTVSWFEWESFSWKKTKDGYTVKRDNLTLFKTDTKKKLTEDYHVLMFGIANYNKIKSANLRPFKKINNTLNQCFLDVKVTYASKKRIGSSYVFQTHVYMELTDKEGFVKSFGQDIFDHIERTPFYGFFRAGESSSILCSPDPATYYPHNFRKINVIRFFVSQKEYDRIISTVEGDKYNKQRIAELLKGNCVSYTARILKLCLNYEIKTDLSLIESLFREVAPKKYGEKIRKWSNSMKSKSKWLVAAIYCFPPFYLISFILGLIINVSAICGFKNHKQYNLIDSLFRPWKIRCDIPRIMFDVLNKYTKDGGEIDRKKYPSGSIFK